jgi:tyrosine-protein kinase Etk/Wzc
MNSAPGRAEDDEIDLMKLVDIIWSGRVSIAAAAAIGLVASWLYVVSTPPTYQANGLLQLEERSSGIALTGAMEDLMGKKTGAVTEMSILKSRMVLDRASEELRLDILAAPVPAPLHVNVLRALGVSDAPWSSLSKYPWGGELIEVSGLTIPTDWGRNKILLESGEAGEFTVMLPDGQTIKGRPGNTVSDPEAGFALLVDRIDAKPGRQFLLGKRSKAAATDAIRGSLAVSETERASSILSLTMKASSPRQAERMLDAVAESYVAQNVSRSAAEAEKSLEFINGQLPIAEEAFRKAQGALNDYQSKQQSVDVTFEAQALLERVSDVERQLGELALAQTALTERVTENHPDYQALLNNKKALEQQLEELKALVSDLPDTQKQVFNLSRDQELTQQTYIQLLNRAQELQVVKASAIGSVRLIDKGQAGTKPIAPRRSMIMALGLLLGGMAGLAITAIRHFLRKGVRSSADLEQIGLPVFATINLSKDASDHRKNRGAMSILTLSHPDDLVVEAFRSLRTSLHFGMLDAKTNSLMLTSSAPGAGKSFTAVNLAAVAAQSGQRVCLIDADLRRGYLRRYFGVPKNHPGFAELLAGEITVDQAKTKGPVEGLDFISSGRFPPNPSELLMRPSLPAILEELNKSYDLIILDAPPVLAVTDPVVICRSVGASIAVVRHMITPMGEVEALIQTLASAGARLNGAILNGYDTSAMGAYKSSGYHYNYRYAYQSDKSLED